MSFYLEFVVLELWFSIQLGNFMETWSAISKVIGNLYPQNSKLEEQCGAGKIRYCVIGE